MKDFVGCIVIAGLLALAVSPPALAAGCALADSHPADSLAAFRGECRNGRVHGKAEILFVRNRDGKQLKAKQFGWFQNGEAQGIHVLVMPTDDAPAYAALLFYRDGKPEWTFALSGANWPKTGNLIEANGLWEDVDGEAAKDGMGYPPLTRADGSRYAEGMVHLNWLRYRIIEYPLAAGVQSVDKEALENFLRHLPIDTPLATLDIERPGGAIFVDDAPAPPAASEQKPAVPAATPGLDELIRRTMGKGT